LRCRGEEKSRRGEGGDEYLHSGNLMVKEQGSFRRRDGKGWDLTPGGVCLESAGLVAIPPPAVVLDMTGIGNAGALVIPLSSHSPDPSLM